MLIAACVLVGGVAGFILSTWLDRRHLPGNLEGVLVAITLVVASMLAGALFVIDADFAKWPL